METKELDQIRTIVNEVIAPLGESLKGVTVEAKAAQEAVGGLRKEVEGLKDALRLGEFKDMDGKVFPLGRAPAQVRSRILGSKRYSVANVIQAILEKDEDLAPMESEISNMFMGLNYPHQSAKSWLIPLSSDPDWLPDARNKPEAEKLARLIAEVYPLEAYDPREELALIKQFRLSKAMDPLTDTLGGSLLALPERGDLVEFLRARIVVTAAGAQMIPLPPGGIDYPLETGQTTFAWRRLGVQADIADSNLATGSGRLTPKELAGMVKIPNSLIRFSRPAVEAVVRRALAADASLAADSGYLEGAGGTLAPLGIINYDRSLTDTPTAAKITLHTASTTGGTGDTYEPEDVGKMIAQIEEAPDQEGPTAWIMRPTKFWNIANKRVDQGGGANTGQFMFPVTRGDLGAVVRKELQGYPVLTSTQVSKARQKGGTGTLTYVLLGNFRRMVVGLLGALELAASTEAGFARNETWLRAILYSDSLLLHAESFCISDQLVL